MTNTEIRNALNSADYSFLRENPHLVSKKELHIRKEYII